MVDVVKTFITEKNGVNLEFEEEISTTDFVGAGGIAFNGDENFLLERVGDIIKCRVPDYSVRPTFVDDVLTNAEYYSTFTQVLANRIARGDFTYVNDNLTSESWKIYDTNDGVTVLRTITYNHTYDGNDQLTKTEASEA